MTRRLARTAGPLFAVVLMAVAVFTVIDHSRHSHQPDSQQVTNPQSVTPTSGGSLASDGSSPSLAGSQASLDDRVKAFAALYFSLSPATSATEVKHAVTPYATRHFLQTAQFGFGTSEADQAMLQEGASLQVTAESGLDGDYINANAKAGNVTLHVTKYDADGNVVTSFNYQQPMTWVKQGNTWFVDAAPRT